MAVQTPQYGGGYGQQNTSYIQRYTQSTGRCELPRSISTTNLETTKQCQEYVKGDLCTTFPAGGTFFFVDLPGYTFTVPNLRGYPAEFRQFVFDRIMDKTAKKSLEDERCLNWCHQATKLEPLHTQGDGNCLLHAASLGMWGFHDRANILRNAVSQAVSHASCGENTLYQRWQYNKQLESQQQGYQLEPRQWQHEWETIVRHASSDPTATATLYSLEEFHVFVLANVLQRPVIMYASQKMRSLNSGGTMQSINFHGVYLPLLWSPSGCRKDPLPLGYQCGHFSALVVIDSTQQYLDGKLVLPLVDCNGQPLPVRFTLQNEDPQSLINDYLSIINVYNQRPTPCASLSVVTKPAYYDRLVGAFIDACHEAYQQQQQQPSYGHMLGTGNTNGYPGGGMVSHDVQYSTAMPGLTESSYAMANRAHIQDANASGVTKIDDHKEKIKCINHCGMFGDPETAGLCSNCHQKSLDAALQQETPASQLQQRTGDSGISSSASMLSSMSIKCPNCSQPGHPGYLGMCANCYTGSQQKQNPSQPQYGNQPTTHSNQTTQPMPMHRYENQQQPLYGNEQPQYSNQGAALQEQANTYETLDEYQKPRLPPHSQELSPPPLPLPRSTASGSDRNKCRTPGCEFFGTAETRFYCSKCFEQDMPSILKEVDVLPSHVTAPVTELPSCQPYESPHPTSQQTVFRLTAPQPATKKCTWCHEYFGAPEYGGLCHGCHRNKVKEDKCPSCHEFFGSEDYGGLCNACFLKKTERETQNHPRVSRSTPSQTSLSSDLPAAAYNFESTQPLPPRPVQHLQQPGGLTKPEPHYQPGYKYATQPQVGTVPQSQNPIPMTRPIPKPRSRTFVTTALTANLHTAPVVSVSSLTPALAAVNISNTNPNTVTDNCFMCTGIQPEITQTQSYSVCQFHAKMMTQVQPPISAPQGGQHYQPVNQNPNMPQYPMQVGHMSTANQTQPFAPNISSSPFSTSFSNQLHTTPQPKTMSIYSYAGGTSLTTSAYNTQESATVMSKPTNIDIGTLASQYQTMQFGGGQQQPNVGSQNPASGATMFPHHTPSSGTGAAAAMLNDLNTNKSGTGISSHLQEEFGTIGGGMHSGQRQAHGYSGGAGVGGGGVIGGASGGAGIIEVAGGNSIGIQARIKASPSEASGSQPKKEKVLCKIAGCSYYANPKLDNLCSNCYEDFYGNRQEH